MFLHRVIILGCFTALLAYGSSAQLPSPTGEIASKKMIKGWLNSGDPRLVAWGAHDVLATSDPELTADLLLLASQWQPIGRSGEEQRSSGRMDERDAMAEVIDTLIQMKVAVPASTLQTLAPDFGPEVSVLLSRMPVEEAGPVAFEFYRMEKQNGSELEYVSAALLALHPEPGFAQDLLAKITVHAEVKIVLPGQGDYGGGGTAGDCLGGVTFARPDWPLIGQHRVFKDDREGGFLIVAGIDPIYAKREELYQYAGRMGCSLYLGYEERRRLIAEMLSISPGQLPWDVYEETTIEFQSPEQLNSSLLIFVEEEQGKFRATAAALVNRDLMTDSEVLQSLPQLKLELVDRRGEGATPLTNLPNLPPRVGWSR
jgi:hypothetical protein